MNIASSGSISTKKTCHLCNSPQSIDTCDIFLKVEFILCQNRENRHTQPGPFEFYDDSQIENAEKYTSFVLKAECMTRVGDIENNEVKTLKSPG